MNPTALPADPARRLALLDAMLQLRAQGTVPPGDEAVAAGLEAALALLGPLRSRLRLERRSPWQPGADGSRVVDAHDVEAVHAAALQLATAIAADGQPRCLALACSGPAVSLSEDGADAEEHAAWQPLDPVDYQTARLLADGIVGAGELMHLHQRACELAPRVPERLAA